MRLLGLEEEVVMTELMEVMILVLDMVLMVEMPVLLPTPLRMVVPLTLLAARAERNLLLESVEMEQVVTILVAAVVGGQAAAATTQEEEEEEARVLVTLQTVQTEVLEEAAAVHSRAT